MTTDRSTPELSPREQQLLRYASEGLTDTAIAYKLGISEATVATYWGRVRMKLGPFSRTELVAVMLRAEREAAVEELRRENEHLVRALQERFDATEVPFYNELLEQAPDAMLIMSAEGRIEYMNGAARDLFGYRKDELTGHDLLELIPRRFRTVHTDHRLTYLQNPQRRQMGHHLETPALHKDGTEFPVRASLSAVNTTNGTIVICILRPIEVG